MCPILSPLSRTVTVCLCHEEMLCNVTAPDAKHYTQELVTASLCFVLFGMERTEILPVQGRSRDTGRIVLAEMKGEQCNGCSCTIRIFYLQRHPLDHNYAISAIVPKNMQWRTERWLSAPHGVQNACVRSLSSQSRVNCCSFHLALVRPG